VVAEEGLRALVVDDEPLARQEMRYLLGRVGGVAECEEAPNALEALALLQGGRYDVVFLDIRMPGLTGMQAMRVIEALPRPPRVVFVTAHEEHALEAFDVAAADYLLKPVSEARLRKALARIGDGGVPGPAEAAGEVVLDRPSEIGRALIPAEQDGRTLLIRAGDLRFASVSGHTTHLHTRDRTYVCRLSLGELEERLAPAGFLRVHRGYLVNLEHVREVSPFFSGAYLLRVDDERRSEVPVSRAAARRLRGILGI
jgi:DNA-binding LytR/AlgR family response regulator